MQPTHTSIAFVVEGEPASKSRARFTGWGSKVRAYTPERTREAESRVAAAYLAAAGRSNKADKDTAFRVTAEFHLHRYQRRDVDNMIKLVLDGLNSVAWDDDSQVIEVSGRKIFGSDVGYTVVAVERVGTIPRPVATCPQCGKEFRRPPTHNKKKYCTAACRSAALDDKMRRTCPTCGTEFRAKMRQQYCTRECGYAARRQVVRCAQCKVPVTQETNLASKAARAYCSDDCKKLYWQSAKPRSRTYGTCDDCGGPTTKASYKRCRACNIAAGGRWADRDKESVRCPACQSFLPDEGTCSRCAKAASS